ncbi:MAG: phosphoribosylamine--glycine ligase [Proteobacteria bacterium]|nr:phosphoribosylamine--glycine ligase [Pseudomonadota bacterium]
MNIAVIGSGGREHALCTYIAKSPRCGALHCLPGNAGIAQVATCVDIAPTDTDGIVAYCQTHDIGLVVIGPETALAANLSGALREADIPVFGPTARTALLETSKKFMKDLCLTNGIPTADYRTFNESEKAREYLKTSSYPIVIKADGLAAGKGVVIAHNLEAALATIDDMMTAGTLGSAGQTVVIEEFLEGEEVSYFVLFCPYQEPLVLTSAQDHKQVGDGDTGPNTGGMGAYSPAPVLTPELEKQVLAQIVYPLTETIQDTFFTYNGVLFLGLMLTKTGPKLLEINTRFGDPETQAILPRLNTDLVDVLYATATSTLKSLPPLSWTPEPSLCVVIAAQGYPGEPVKGSVIGNVDAAANMTGITLFHAGTRQQGNDLVAAGGRVLGVTATAATLAEAQKRAYAAVDTIHWPQGFCRRDIGWRALKNNS